MNYSRALQHVTQDRNSFSKLAVAGLIGLVPVLNLALQGYSVDHARNVMAGRDVPLPDWNDLGAKFQRGLILALAHLAYALPVVLVSFILTMALSLGSVVIGAAASSSSRAVRDLAALLNLASLPLTCLSLVAGLAIALLTPGIFRQYVKAGTFAACFQFGEILAFTRRRLADIIVVLLVTGAIIFFPMLGMMILQFIPCLGWIAGLFLVLAALAYYYPVNAHLLGQLIAQDDAALAAARPPR